MLLSRRRGRRSNVTWKGASASVLGKRRRGIWFGTFFFVRAPAVSDHKEEEKVRIRSTVVAKWRWKSSTKKEGRDKKAPLYNRVTCISRKGNSHAGLQVYPLFHAFFVPAVQHESWKLYLDDTSLCHRYVLRLFLYVEHRVRTWPNDKIVSLLSRDATLRKRASISSEHDVPIISSLSTHTLS